MSRYSEMYRQRVAKSTNGSARQIRLQQAKDNYDRNFKDIMGYLQAEYLDADMVNNSELAKPLDIVISTNTNGYERLISCRPDTLLKVGTYIYYEEMGIKKIAIIRELLKSEPIPTYKAFECSQTLTIKNCPYPFPCFSYNSTYSSKGLIDTDRNYILDSRNKLYIQKNEFSCRLWEQYHGYRIILGDDDGTVVFKITEMDDFSYKGMFIVSLKVEQRHHLDGVENKLWAYNEKEIDFSDLGNSEEEGVEVIKPLEIMSEMYYRVGDTFEMIATKPVNEWNYDLSFFSTLEIEDEYTLKGKLAKTGKLIIKAIDADNQEATKTIIIKERD